MIASTVAALIAVSPICRPIRRILCRPLGGSSGWPPCWSTSRAGCWRSELLQRSTTC